MKHEELYEYLFVKYQKRYLIRNKIEKNMLLLKLHGIVVNVYLFST